MSTRAVRSGLMRLPLLAALSLSSANAQEDIPCSGSWENCSASMCCSTPFFECVEKNPLTKHEGKVVPPYAQCRFANHTSSCPCKNPPCVDYSHDYNLEVKLPWSCTVLTGGCSPAFKPCGPGKNLDADAKKNYQGKPCCQWGCTCDYSQKWAAQCKPPNGSYACTKDAEKAVVAKQAGSSLFSIVDGGRASVRTTPGSPLPWLAAIACAAVFVSSVAIALRKGRSQRLLHSEDAADAEADVHLQEGGQIQIE